MFINVTSLFKVARERSPFSQRELANALGYSSPQMISNWERKKCGVPYDIAGKLCLELGVDYFGEYVPAAQADFDLFLKAKAPRKRRVAS